MAVKTQTYEYERVANSLRGAIGKEYMPGDLLTPERELAKRFSVSHSTIRKALDVLSHEGIIGRHQGQGTVIVNRLATGEFAVVVRPQLLGPEASPAYRMATTAIIENLRRHNSRWKIKMHLGEGASDGSNGHDWAATLDLLEPDVLKRLRGVFTFNPLWELEPRLTEAKVPVIMFGARSSGYRVCIDEPLFYEQAVSHLKEVGCRRIGFLWGGSARPLKPHEQRDVMVSEVARNLGLECRTEWMPYHAGDIAERSGYELFMRFWNQLNRPEGILVGDDILCRGVLRAMYHLRLKLPEDLRLITYANKDVELPYHLPVSRVEFDPAELARQAVDMMLTLINGQMLERSPIMLPGQLIKGSTP